MFRQLAPGLIQHLLKLLPAFQLALQGAGGLPELLCHIRQTCAILRQHLVIASRTSATTFFPFRCGQSRLQQLFGMRLQYRKQADIRIRQGHSSICGSKRA